MLRMGLPAGAVKNAILRDGKDPSIIDLDPEKSLKSQIDGPDEEKDDGPPLCEDPEFAKVDLSNLVVRSRVIPMSYLTRLLSLISVF
jgi:hypothetical protein